MKLACSVEAERHCVDLKAGVELKTDRLNATLALRCTQWRSKQDRFSKQEARRQEANLEIASRPQSKKQKETSQQQM